MRLSRPNTFYYLILAAISSEPEHDVSTKAPEPGQKVHSDSEGALDLIEDRFDKPKLGLVTAISLCLLELLLRYVVVECFGPHFGAEVAVVAVSTEMGAMKSESPRCLSKEVAIWKMERMA